MPTTRNIICPHCGKLARASEVILKSDRMAQKLGFRGIEELIIHYRADGLTYKEMHERTGISKRTLEDNAPDFLRGLRRQTKRQKDASRNNLKKAVAARMKKYFDHPTANGKSKKQMSLEAMAKARLKMFGGDMDIDELGRELESKQPNGAGVYYAPKDLSCQVNIMIKGIDCKDRTKDTSDWCDNCKEKYIKIIDPASGSGNFLNDITKNPPFSGNRCLSEKPLQLEGLFTQAPIPKSSMIAAMTRAIPVAQPGIGTPKCSSASSSRAIPKMIV